MKRKLKFKDYKISLEANQLEKDINHLGKILVKNLVQLV